MGIVMVAMLAFGGTFAYFTAKTASGSAEFTTGTVSLTSNIGSSFVTITADKVVPGQKITNGAITLTNASDVDTYTAVSFEFTAKRGATDATAEEIAALKTALKLDLDTANWTQTTDKSAYIYTGSEYQLPKTATNFTTAAIEFYYDENRTEGKVDAGTVDLQGLTVTISIVAYSTQKDNLGVTTESADTVWTAMKTALGL